MAGPTQNNVGTHHASLIPEALVLHERSKRLSRFLQLWKCIGNDVGMCRVSFNKVLMIFLSWIEALQSGHLGDDRFAEHFGLLQLLDVGLCNLLLLLVGVCRVS